MWTRKNFVINKSTRKRPFDELSKTVKKGSTLTAVVSKVDEAGIEVDCEGVKGFISALNYPEIEMNKGQRVF